MTKLKKVRYIVKARTVSAFVLLSGFFVTLFAAAVLLAPPDRVLAQQSAQSKAQTQQVIDPKHWYLSNCNDKEVSQVRRNCTYLYLTIMRQLSL